MLLGHQARRWGDAEGELTLRTRIDPWAVARELQELRGFLLTFVAMTTRALELRATERALATIALEVRRRTAFVDERVTLLQKERLDEARELRAAIAELDARLTRLQARSHEAGEVRP